LPDLNRPNGLLNKHQKVATVLKNCAQFRAKMANQSKLVAFNKIKMFQKAELWSKKTHLATLGDTPGEGEGSCRASD